MLLLEWNNPKTTLGELETWISNYLGSLYDGLNLEGSKLWVRTTDVLTSEQEDYIKSYYYKINDVATKVSLQNPIDTDGAMLLRPKAAKAGWTYQLRAMEFETSVLSSIYNHDVNGNDIGDCGIKLYDSNNTELTTQGSCDTDCVKTVCDFEPLHDYEIIGGTIKTVSGTSEDCRVWVIAVPDVPANYGGSKVMVNSVNLRFVDANNGIEVNGRASKYMVYSNVYHSNKLRVVFKHPAGLKLKIMIAYEFFKA